MRQVTQPNAIGFSKSDSKVSVALSVDSAGKEKWSQIIGRRSKNKASAISTPKKETDVSLSRSVRRAPPLRRAPRIAAVQISCRGDFTHVQAMSLAKQKIDLGALGIEDIRPRKARTGVLLLEIPGTDGTRKANILANQMRDVLREHEDVLITRPEKTADVRLRDIEESVSKEEIGQRIASLRGCNLGSIKVGEISPSFNGMGFALIRCPVLAANKIAKERRIRIG
ncbi:PREDICTED: uncharacterized protein LOC108782238 [Cyphomyrmex costatus]|uniref:uncharacterized protein LOC108782238 n=1 Tax=Cyphomyrmex costatus TaxID=456900 RepID=UPI0008522D71|nr:PREDICTED: uncharacterized protein LOC108782238 [Cyphomyrmex costatus]